MAASRTSDRVLQTPATAGNGRPTGATVGDAADAPSTAAVRSEKPVAGRRTPQKAPDPGYVAVGRVLSPFGLKGEVKVQVLTDNPQRFAPRSRLYAGTQAVTVMRSREAQGYVYLTLKGFADRSSIEQFRHALLQVPEADLPTLPEGEFYRYQLIGLSVVDREGAALGTLDEIIETGVNDVYRVRTAEGKDILLPALDDVILSIDLASNTMRVDPPDWR